MRIVRRSSLQPHLETVAAVGDDLAFVVAPVPLEGDAARLRLLRIGERGDVRPVGIDDRDVEALRTPEQEGAASRLHATAAGRREMAAELRLPHGEADELQPLASA